jgi:hypothetical protein
MFVQLVSNFMVEVVGLLDYFYGFPEDASLVDVCPKVSVLLKSMLCFILVKGSATADHQYSNLQSLMCFDALVEIQ